MKYAKQNEAVESLGWTERVAVSVSWLGIVGLILMIAENSWSAPPPPGMPAGNPFVGGKPGTNAPTYYEDDEEDSVEFPDAAAKPTGKVAMPGAIAPSPSGSTRSVSVGGTPIDTTPLPRSDQGISLGGGTASGIVSNREMAPLEVGNESGEGSNEVVTDFNFPDADILDIAKTLGKLTGKNFILDKDVRGRITIISNTPITVGDAWRAFLTALDMNQFALVPTGKYIRIIKNRDARDKNLRTYTGNSSPNTDALITRVFALKYLNAEEVMRNFRTFMPSNSRIIAFDQTNTIIVTDTGSNIARLEKMLEFLDVEGFDAGIEVVPVKHASATDLAKLIDQLIPGSSAVPGAPRPAGRSQFSARKTKEGGVINTIIADERTNTLIVHANNKGAEQVRVLVAKLDQRLPATQAGGKVHVVYLQFAEAEQVAATLNNLSSQAAGGAPKAPLGTGTNPVKASLFEDSIRVAPDKSTNSLVITASQSDFDTIRRVINKIDIPRDQVYAEVIIMEVNVGRDSSFSANLISPIAGLALAPKAADVASFITNPIGGLSGFALGLPIGGTKNYDIGGKQFAVSSVIGLVKAIQTTNGGNILATPQILTLDNTEAIFESSENIPVPTVTAVQGAVSTGFTKEKVALSIKIKPQINKLSNFIKLNIKTKMADISPRELPANVAGNALATFERSAETEVVVADKDTVVLGGLTRDDVNNTVSKVPVLGDIPLLGWLFRSKTTQVRKVNLLIFITPHVIRQYESIRAILDKKLKERDEFIEYAAGGDDPQKRYRDRLIRGLPSIDELKKKPVGVATSIGSSSQEAMEDDESAGGITKTARDDGSTVAPGAGESMPLPPGGGDPGYIPPSDMGNPPPDYNGGDDQ